MKHVGWILLGLSLLMFLLGSYSMFAGPGNYLFKIGPEAWWRGAMAAVVYAIALKILHGDVKVTE
jgi:hypothetical protein